MGKMEIALSEAAEAVSEEVAKRSMADTIEAA